MSLRGPYAIRLAIQVVESPRITLEFFEDFSRGNITLSMQNTPSPQFGPYRLEPNDERLWRGNQVVRLTSKAFQVLCQFVARPQQLITKDELFASVWPDTVVSDAALTSCIRELRQALQDNARSPSYIETVHRRGFRFLKSIETRPSASELPLLPPTVMPLPRYVVGRQDELEQLHRCQARSLHGKRQVVFVTGEPGIGKTTLVAELIARLAEGEPVWIGQGQCIEHYGAGEAYMPVLEALGRLCRGPYGEHLVAHLRQYAPTWLVQMPALLEPDELEALQLRVTGTSPGRMLREMAEAIETITVDYPLVLILEDLQWSDSSTVELLAALARRRESARLLVLATYRPADVLVREHPLHRAKQELLLHGQCQELALRFLSEAAVDYYLSERFGHAAPSDTFLPGVASFIHRWTEGNPLFMVTLVNELVQQNMISEVGGEWGLHRPLEEGKVMAPASVQHLIEQHIEQLSAVEREVLEAASVAGADFSAATLALGNASSAETVEAVCEELARRSQFVRGTGTSDWPDGTVAGRYGFIHALYQDALYTRVPPGRRARLHQQIGEKLEAGYGDQALMIAAELGMHFEKGQDYARAASYWSQAGNRAATSSGYPEAVACFEQALAALAQLPDCRNTLEQGLDIRLRLRNALHPLGEDERILDNLRLASAIAEELDDRHQLGQIALYLCIYFSSVDDYDRAVVEGQRALSLGGSINAIDLQVVAQNLLGMVCAEMGDNLQALDLSRRAMALLVGELLYERLGQVLLPALMCRGQGALGLAELGRFAAARSMVEEALELAETVAEPYQIASTLRYVGMIYHRQGDFGKAIPVLERCLELSQLTNITRFFPLIAATLGAAYAVVGRVADALPLLNEVLERMRTEDRVVFHAHVLRELSEALLLIGEIEEASACAERLNVLSRSHTGPGFQAHASRLLGGVAMHHEPPETESAESYYLEALTLADEHGLRPLQAHCYRSLGTLYSQIGELEKAHSDLSKALEMYRNMEMAFWLPQAEMALTQVM